MFSWCEWGISCLFVMLVFFVMLVVFLTGWLCFPQVSCDFVMLSVFLTC